MEKKDDDTVFITSKVNEIFATTELIQYFTNPLDNPIELSILFPIKDELSLSKFVVTIDDQIILSKVNSHIDSYYSITIHFPAFVEPSCFSKFWFLSLLM